MTRQITPRREGEPEVDLTVGHVEHRAIRADLRRLTEALAGAGEVPRERARAIRVYLDRLIFAIVRHHRIEDEALWPLLAASAPGELELDSLSEDHVRLDALLERVGESAARFAQEPAAERAALHGLVRELRDLLEEHLAEEEATVFPAVARYVSLADYEVFERAARKRFSVGDLTFMGPWLAGYASRAERDRALAPSWPYRVILALGRPSYRRLERRTFGT
ncbi:hemerythrin domain-containing protein [Bailinhaonella thermotolerans]|uniref:Hemerythrin domain-containing protein n=1 Tax=Bailinhaonella thermotolerans TaxID=1070861 RepID=A0A3A4BKQ3_9ACTN|nr:hemerythrin domain-containing protein [Bailinhaonella thermotolerans]RJL35924.1 hemerythrin domain-containing protein [Bailinhaonella thermotolerans]